MNCSRCGAQFGQGLRFCEICGSAALPAKSESSPASNPKKWVLIGAGGFVALVLTAGAISRFVIHAKEPSATEAVKPADVPTSSKVAWHNVDRKVQFKSCLAMKNGSSTAKDLESAILCFRDFADQEESGPKSHGSEEAMASALELGEIYSGSGRFHDNAKAAHYRQLHHDWEMFYEEERLRQENLMKEPEAESSAVVASTEHTASFDCTKAFTKTETTICSNPSLADADRAMADAYKNTLRSLSGPTKREFQTAHRAWFRSYTSTCNASSSDGDTVKCVKEFLTEYTQQLTSRK